MLARSLSKAAALFALLVLAVMASRALRESRRVAPDTVVVLYSATDPAAVRTLECPAGRCLFVDVAADPCAVAGGASRAVIVTGHSAPPLYLGRSPEQLAAAIACFRPELLVLDTCYGFSAPLLDALAAEGVSPLVVGATSKLPPSGLLYGAPFYAERAPDARAAAVTTRSGAPLERWTIDRGALRETEEQVARWGPADLQSRLKRLHPNLVQASLPSSEATVLIVVPKERFRR